MGSTPKLPLHGRSSSRVCRSNRNASSQVSSVCRLPLQDTIAGIEETARVLTTCCEYVGSSGVQRTISQRSSGRQDEELEGRGHPDKGNATVMMERTTGRSESYLTKPKGPLKSQYRYIMARRSWQSCTTFPAYMAYPKFTRNLFHALDHPHTNFRST